MATIRKLRGRWQAQVRRRGAKPRCKSFDSKLGAEKWARDLEAQVDRFGAAPDTKILESTTVGQLLERYQGEVSPLKRGSVQEIQRIDVLRRHDLPYRTMIGLSQQDIASFRDERLQTVAPSTTVRELAILSHVLEVAMRATGNSHVLRRLQSALNRHWVTMFNSYGAMIAGGAGAMATCLKAHIFFFRSWRALPNQRLQL